MMKKSVNTLMAIDPGGLLGKALMQQDRYQNKYPLFSRLLPETSEMFRPSSVKKRICRTVHWTQTFNSDRLERYSKAEYSTFQTAASSVESVSLLVARRTNNRKVVGSRPTKVVCITVWQVTAWSKLSVVAGRHSFWRAVRSWSLDCQRWWTRIWHG